MSDPLSPAESLIMRETFRSSMRRAATIIDQITESDVLDAQRALLLSGCSLIQVARVDRGMIAAAHLRACAENLKDEREIASYTRDALKRKVQL